MESMILQCKLPSLTGNLCEYQSGISNIENHLLQLLLRISTFDFLFTIIAKSLKNDLAMKLIFDE